MTDLSSSALTLLWRKNLNDPEPIGHKGIERLRIGFKIKLISWDVDWAFDAQSDIERAGEVNIWNIFSFINPLYHWDINHRKLPGWKSWQFRTVYHCSKVYLIFCIIWPPHLHTSLDSQKQISHHWLSSNETKNYTFCVKIKPAVATTQPTIWYNCITFYKETIQ